MNYLLSIPLNLLPLFEAVFVWTGKSFHGGRTLRHSPGCYHGQARLVSAVVSPYLNQVVAANTDQETGEIFAIDRNADVLLFDAPLLESSKTGEMKFYAYPGIIGKIAAQTNTKRPVLGHFMIRNPKGLDQTQVGIRIPFATEMDTGREQNCKEFG